MSVFLGLLMVKPYLLALMPVLAALRGSVMTSMASRVTSKLYLGLYRPRAREILGSEAPRTVSLALLSSVYAAIVIAMVSDTPVTTTIPISVVSAFVATILLLPLTVAVVTIGYRRSLDPDNYVAPVLTVLGDVSTVPSLVLASLLVGWSLTLDTLLTVLLAYTTLLLAFTVLIGREPDRRVIMESLIGLVFVGLLESGTGGMYDRYATALFTLTVLHMTPSMMEDIGAALSVFASRMTTLTHLHGTKGSIKRAPQVMAEVVSGSIPAMIVLSLIGYLTGQLAYDKIAYTSILAVVAVTWLLMLLILSPLTILIAWASTRLGLDPDNIVLPLITSTVDITLIPFIVYITASII